MLIPSPPSMKNLPLSFQLPGPLIKPCLLQESRLIDGGSPNLVDLVECKVPVEWILELQQNFIHDCTLVLHARLIHTGSVMLLLPFSYMPGFTLYEDIGNGRAIIQQIYRSDKEVGYTLMTMPLYYLHFICKSLPTEKASTLGMWHLRMHLTLSFNSQ